MTQDADRSFVDQLGEKPLVRVLAYYVALMAVALLLQRIWPGLIEYMTAKIYGKPGSLDGPEVGAELLAGVAAVCLSAIALMLPVAWICALTRSKQGYRQSLVQTLLILPVVVAGIVGIVRNSQALAFGLAGVVAAVSFRNRLEDSKDAVYIFIAIAVGFACGVQAVDIALVVSIIFNVLVLIIWSTDFGRVPGAVQGGPVENRLKRAMALANRTQQFVSQIDQEILRSLGPEQLAQVANRVAARQGPFTVTMAGGAEKKPPRPMRPLGVVISESGSRKLVDEALDEYAKKWVFKTANPGTRGQQTFRYDVRLRRKMADDAFIERLRKAGGGGILDVTLGPEPKA